MHLVQALPWAEISLKLIHLQINTRMFKLEEGIRKNLLVHLKILRPLAEKEIWLFKQLPDSAVTGISYKNFSAPQLQEEIDAGQTLGCDPRALLLQEHSLAWLPAPSKVSGLPLWDVSLVLSTPNQGGWC